MTELVYLSPEWAEEALRRLQTQLTPEQMKHLSSSMLTIYEDCPDGKLRAMYYKITDGVFAELSVWEQDWPEAEFTVRGKYETFAKISRSELKSRRALMSGKLSLRGNLARALSLAVIVDRFNEVLAGIPTSY